MKRALLILAFCFQFAALAATYVVSTTGNNSNDGSTNNPWLTPRYATSTMAANDTVIMRGGTYPSDGFLWAEFKSGTGGSYTKIKNYPGETVVYAPTVFNHGILIQDRTNVWLEGITVNALGAASDALKVTSDGLIGGNIILTNMTFYGCPRGHGVLTSSLDPAKSVLVTHCNFYTNGWNGQSPDSPLHQIYIQDSNVTVEDCYVQGTTNSIGGTPGIQLNNSGCTNQVYRRNFFTNCFDSGIIAAGAGSEALIYDNIFVGCQRAIYFHLISNSRAINNTVYNSWSPVIVDSSTNVWVENNTGSGGTSEAIGRFYVTGSSNVFMRNNLACSNYAAYLDFNTNTDNVAVTVSGNRFARTAQGTNEIYDTKFVNASAGNFGLNPGSSAIGIGRVQPLVPLDKLGRPHRTVPDAGALASGVYFFNSTFGP